MAAAQSASTSLSRDKILDISIRLFQQKGFSGLGMRQIAQFLNIKAPSLYHHFISKEALAQQSLERYREQQVERFKAIEAGSIGLARLDAYMELFAEMLNDGVRPCLYLVMVREPAMQEPQCANELHKFAQQNIDWLVSVLEDEFPKNGLASRMERRSLAEILFASLEGLMALSLIEKNPGDAFRKRAQSLLGIFDCLKWRLACP